MGGMRAARLRVKDRKLVVDEPDAADQVRWIFARFLEIGSATVLARELRRDAASRPRRGSPIDKSYLYQLLNNRAYIGEAVHKGTSYPGEHAAIIDRRTLGQGPRHPRREKPAPARRAHPRARRRRC